MESMEIRHYEDLPGPERRIAGGRARSTSFELLARSYRLVSQTTTRIEATRRRVDRLPRRRPA